MISSIALVLAVVCAANGGILPQTGLQYAYTGTPLTYSYSPYHYPLIRSAFPVLTTQYSGPLETNNIQPAEPIEKAKPLKPLKATQYTIPQVVVPQLFYNALPQPLISAPVVQQHQFHSQDALGSYHFGHYGGQSSRNEYKDHFGNVAGSYNYIDSDGKTQTVHYTAGKDGFNVAATNLPVAPIAELNPVQETPEVAKARTAFQAAFDKATQSNVAVDTPVEAVPAEAAPTEAVATAARKKRSTPAEATPADTAPVAPVAATPSQVVAIHGSPYHYPFLRSGLTPFNYLPTLYNNLPTTYSPLLSTYPGLRFYPQPQVYSGIKNLRPAEHLQVVNNPGHAYSYTVLQ